jgi:DNA polymerase-1
MLIQVHDELLFEVPREQRAPTEEFVRRKMEKVFSLKVPLRIEIGWGADWTGAHA